MGALRFLKWCHISSFCNFYTHSVKSHIGHVMQRPWNQNYSKGRTIYIFFEFFFIFWLSGCLWPLMIFHAGTCILCCHIYSLSDKFKHFYFFLYIYLLHHIYQLPNLFCHIFGFDYFLLNQIVMSLLWPRLVINLKFVTVTH